MFLFRKCESLPNIRTCIKRVCHQNHKMTASNINDMTIANGIMHNFDLNSSLSAPSTSMNYSTRNPAWRKVRQHVNPLSSKYLQPINLPNNWIAEAFPNVNLTNRPLVIDIGCSRGSWALNSAKMNPQTCYLGLEIRRPVVEFALERKMFNQLSNVHFLSGNANVDIDGIMKSAINAGMNITTITIQFPDPHFKNRHKKRRVVQPELVEVIADNVKSGSHLFVQSDILDVAKDMVETISECSRFIPVTGYDPLSLENNESPHEVQTEREIATKNKNLPVFRMLFRRV